MKSSVICLFCLRTLALAARFELNHLEEGLEVGQTVLIVSGKYKGCQGLVERVVGSKIQVLRRCSDGHAGDGKSWWYRSGQVEELEEESLLVEKEDEVVSTSSLSLLADEAYRSDHPYCDKYKDLPPLYPGAHVPELRQRPVLRRGRPFRLTGAVGASAEVGLIGTVPRPVELSSIIQVDLPPTAPVGEYELRTMDDENKTLATFTFLVIFNPFTCPACPEHADVDEDYVLGDEGLLWQGLSDDYTANHWTFEPFRGANLLISLSLLAPLPPESRGDVATLTRFLTNAVGEKVCYGKWGEGDYLKGRPKKGYTCRSKQHVKRFPQRWAHRCRDPSTWDSSSALLEQHWGLVASGSSATAVQYCQCFVFSGVLTTIGRSLGLATRSVTNFQSAHDVNGDRGVSRFFFTTPEGVWEPVEFTDDLCPKWCNRKEKAEKKGCDLLRCTKALSRGRGFQKDCKPCMPCVPCHSVDDSVWSFHVWNEIYFSRGRHAADGWQALDATPQELSGGKFQMGPASVQEVRKGNSDCYDTDFVISEVNGDTKLYVYQVSDLEAATKRKAIEVGDFVLHRGDPLYLGMRWYMDPFGDAYNTVGFKVVTKKPGPVPEACWRNSRLCQSEELDLTGSYKRCPDVHDRKPSCAAGYSKPISCEAAEVVPSFLEEEIQEAMVQRHLHELGENTDVEANFSDFVGPVELGRDLPLRILFRNRGHEKRRLQLGITAVVSDYRGVPVIHMETRSRKYAVKLPLDGRKTLLKRHLELLPGEVTSFGHVVKRKNLDRGTLQSMEVNAADGRFFVQFHVSVVTDRGQRFGHEPRRLLREPE